CTLSSRVIGRSSQSGSPARGWFTLGTIGRVALFSSHLKCQHYYESGQSSPLANAPQVADQRVQKSSGFGTPRTRFATEYVFAALASALRAGISEREQRAARGRFTAPGRDEFFATESRVWSPECTRSRCERWACSRVQQGFDGAPEAQILARALPPCRQQACARDIRGQSMREPPSGRRSR